MNQVVQKSREAAGSCPKCGVEVRKGADFCYNCGGRIIGQEAVVDRPGQAESDLSKDRNGLHSKVPGDFAVQTARRRRNTRHVSARTKEPIQVIWKRSDDIGSRFLMLTLFAAVFVLILITIAYYLK